MERLRLRSIQGPVASSLCTATRPLYTIRANTFGALISEATMRPNPRSILYLCPEDPPEYYLAFMRKNGIRLLHYGIVSPGR